MSEYADELNNEVVELIAKAIRPRVDEVDEVALADMIVDIVRELNDAGYRILRPLPNAQAS